MNQMKDIDKQIFSQFLEFGCQYPKQTYIHIVMNDLKDEHPKRSISQNDSPSYDSSVYSHNYVWNSNRDKLSNDNHQDRLRQQARRFVSRIRKQKQYNEGKYLLMRQKEEIKRQKEETLMRSLHMEKQEIQRSKKMSVALEKILVNQCKREKRIINELTQKLRQEIHQQAFDQLYQINQQQPQITFDQTPKVVAKKFKTVESQKSEQKENTLNLPSIINKHELKHKTEAVAENPTRFFKPKQERQIYLTKIDQIKLKAIESKIKKLNKLFNQSHEGKI